MRQCNNVILFRVCFSPSFTTPPPYHFITVIVYSDDDCTTTVQLGQLDGKDLIRFSAE